MWQFVPHFYLDMTTSMRALGDAAPAGSFLDVMSMVDDEDEDYWLYPIIF